MIDTRKEARRKWDKENTLTVSTRLSREQVRELREKLTAHGITTHTFLKRMCELCLAGKLEHQLNCMTNQMTREERDAELDAIVREC